MKKDNLKIYEQDSMEGYGGLNFKTLHKFQFFKNFRKTSKYQKKDFKQFLSIIFLYNNNTMESM